METRDQGQLDAKTLRYMSENAEVEHTLLTPFRWLIGAGKIIIYTLLLLSWFLFTLCGWVFNVGEYSLENRREAVCDPRAYLPLCEPYEFNGTHPHRDYELNLGRVVDHGDQGIEDDSLTLDDSTYTEALRGGQSFYPSGSAWTEENVPGAKPWFSFEASNGFFDRGNDVFRRKSVQMDGALMVGEAAMRSLMITIADAKHLDRQPVILPDAPDLIIREGVMPADAIGSKGPVTWGLCLKQECASDGSDLNYALFWDDVLWTRPALGQHQQHAVDALNNMDTLAFWLQEAHANGVQDDESIQKQFGQYQHNRTMTGQDFEREVLHEK